MFFLKQLKNIASMRKFSSLCSFIQTKFFLKALNASIPKVIFSDLNWRIRVSPWTLRQVGVTGPLVIWLQNIVDIREARAFERLQNLCVGSGRCLEELASFLGQGEINLDISLPGNFHFHFTCSLTPLPSSCCFCS